MHTKSRALWPTFIAVALVISACGAAPSATPSTTPSAATAPTSAPSASPSIEPESAPPAAPSDIAAAIAFREQFGLRSDEGWVRAVAANPAAVMDYEVPLLPFERDQILERATGDDVVIQAVREYLDAHADIAGGVYVDQARGGTVTVLVTADPALHEAALRARIGDAARLAVRQVTWTEAELLDLQERISADQGFLTGLPARMMTSSVDIMTNRVELAISSAVPDAAAQIAAHHGAKPGQLVVHSDGTGLLLMPTGRIVGRIVAPAGTDMGTLSPQAEADVDIGARDAVGVEVKKDGTFVLDRLPPTTYTVTILQLGDAPREVGRARVTVPAGGAARVEIPVDLR